MKTTNLFSEFPPVSAKQWKQKIQYDLKGADYNETLVWESLEGIHVRPFYHSEDVDGMATFSLPKDHIWRIGQFIYAGNENLANKKALDILQKGVGTLVFKIPKKNCEWATLLANIPLETTPVHFDFEFLEVENIKKLIKHVGNTQTNFSFNLDLIGNLARSGNWYHNQKEDHRKIEAIVQLANENAATSIISVDVSLYQNAGANIVQQLAYALGHTNEYFDHFDKVLVNAKEKPVVFKVAIGSNYFFEIAKLKALRWLIKTLASEYGLQRECHIMAFPSKRNKTLYDYNVNMLRSSSESMAAVLGGADTVCNIAYDAMYHKENEFGERIARNQLVLLKEESYFDEAIHAAEGNYYIESLTQQLADKALELFKEIEKSGGFLHQLKNGTIQKKIKESALKEQNLFDKGDITLVGTNKFQNSNERMKETLELYPFVKTNKRKTKIEPIIERRLAEGLEQKRLEDE